MGVYPPTNVFLDKEGKVVEIENNTIKAKNSAGVFEKGSGEDFEGVLTCLS